MASNVITGERFAAESFHAWEAPGKRKLEQLITAGSPQVLLHWLWLAKAWQGASASNTDRLLTHPLITELFRSTVTENFSFGRAVYIAGPKY